MGDWRARGKLGVGVGLTVPLERVCDAGDEIGVPAVHVQGPLVGAAGVGDEQSGAGEASLQVGPSQVVVLAVVPVHGVHDLHDATVSTICRKLAAPSRDVGGRSRDLFCCSGKFRRVERSSRSARRRW